MSITQTTVHTLDRTYTYIGKMHLLKSIPLVISLVGFVACKTALNPKSGPSHQPIREENLSSNYQDFDVATGHDRSSSHSGKTKDPVSFADSPDSPRTGRHTKMVDAAGKLKVRHKGKERRYKKISHDNQELGWHYCADGGRPIDLKDINETEYTGMGYMCGKMYPSSTCCYDHDTNMDVTADQILEEIPQHECARMLMKLRCAHCSPRSWRLFHAPDRMRLPHKRVLPIMCPSFCKRFHGACRNSVAGLEGHDFCEYHTTDEDGPCFPDSVVRRGSID